MENPPLTAPPSSVATKKKTADVNRPDRPIAAIDIGSNSIQITIARLTDRTIDVLHREKDVARLAKALGADGFFSNQTLDQTLATLQKFRALADDYGAIVRTTATATVRRARNGDDLIERAATELGLDVQIITGADEGRLVLAGVIHGLPELQTAAPLCIDVGGGSTELILGAGGRARILASVPIGALVVQRRWLGGDPVGRSSARRASAQLMSLFSARADDMKRAGFSRVIATGGSAQRIARICRASRGDVTQDVHRDPLSRADIDAVVARLVRSKTHAERLAIPGLDPDRADSLLGGALIFQAVGRLLGVESWTVSMSALRSGLLVDTHRALNRGESVLRR